MRYLKITVFLMAFAAFAFCIISLLSIDACMDAGGHWFNFGYSCVEAREGFVPLTQRGVVTLWGSVIFVSVLLAATVTWLVNRILLRH